MSYAGSEGSRGVVVIWVTDDEANANKGRMLELHPNAMEGSEHVWTAALKAHELGISPGGQVAFDEVNPDTFPVDCIGRLISPAELIERGLGEQPWLKDKPNG